MLVDFLSPAMAPRENVSVIIAFTKISKKELTSCHATGPHLLFMLTQMRKFGYPLFIDSKYQNQVRGNFTGAPGITTNHIQK